MHIIYPLVFTPPSYDTDPGKKTNVKNWPAVARSQGGLEDELPPPLTMRNMGETLEIFNPTKHKL